MQRLELVKKIIGKGNSMKAIDELISFMEEHSFNQKKDLQPYYDDSIVLQSRLNSLEERTRRGFLEQGDYSREKGKIDYATIEIVNNIQKYTDLDYSSYNNNLAVRVEKIKEEHEFEYDIFLSFSNKDIEIATDLWSRLAKYGFNVFFSSEFFKDKVGSSYNDEISNALENSKSLVLLWSKKSKNSKWVKIEWETFFNECYNKQKGRNLYIFEPRNGFNVELPIFLRSLQRTQSAINLIKSIVETEEKLKYQNIHAQSIEKPYDQLEEVLQIDIDGEDLIIDLMDEQVVEGDNQLDAWLDDKRESNIEMFMFSAQKNHTVETLEEKTVVSNEDIEEEKILDTSNDTEKSLMVTKRTIFVRILLGIRTILRFIFFFFINSMILWIITFLTICFLAGINRRLSHKDYDDISIISIIVAIVISLIYTTQQNNKEKKTLNKNNDVAKKMKKLTNNEQEKASKKYSNMNFFKYFFIHLLIIVILLLIVMDKLGHLSSENSKGSFIGVIVISLIISLVFTDYKKHVETMKRAKNK